MNNIDFFNVEDVSERYTYDDLLAWNSVYRVFPNWPPGDTTNRVAGEICDLCSVGKLNIPQLFARFMSLRSGVDRARGPLAAAQKMISISDKIVIDGGSIETFSKNIELKVDTSGNQLQVIGLGLIPMVKKASEEDLTTLVKNDPPLAIACKMTANCTYVNKDNRIDRSVNSNITNVTGVESDVMVYLSHYEKIFIAAKTVLDPILTHDPNFRFSAEARNGLEFADRLYCLLINHPFKMMFIKRIMDAIPMDTGKGGFIVKRVDIPILTRIEPPTYTEQTMNQIVRQNPITPKFFAIGEIGWMYFRDVSRIPRGVKDYGMSSMTNDYWYDLMLPKSMTRVGVTVTDLLRLKPTTIVLSSEPKKGYYPMELMLGLMRTIKSKRLEHKIYFMSENLTSKQDIDTGIVTISPKFPDDIDNAVFYSGDHFIPGKLNVTLPVKTAYNLRWMKEHEMYPDRCAILVENWVKLSAHVKKVAYVNGAYLWAKGPNSEYKHRKWSPSCAFHEGLIMVATDDVFIPEYPGKNNVGLQRLQLDRDIFARSCYLANYSRLLMPLFGLNYPRLLRDMKEPCYLLGPTINSSARRTFLALTTDLLFVETGVAAEEYNDFYEYSRVAPKNYVPPRSIEPADRGSSVPPPPPPQPVATSRPSTPSNVKTASAAINVSNQAVAPATFDSGGEIDLSTLWQGSGYGQDGMVSGKQQ